MGARQVAPDAAKAGCHLCSAPFTTRLDLGKHLVAAHQLGTVAAIIKAAECFQNPHLEIEPPPRPVDAGHQGYAPCLEVGCFAFGELVYGTEHVHRPIAVMNPEDEVPIEEEIRRPPRGSQARVLAAEREGSATMPPKNLVRRCSNCGDPTHRSDNTRCPGRKPQPPGEGKAAPPRPASAPPAPTAPPPPRAAMPAAPSAPKPEGPFHTLLARQSAEHLIAEWRRAARLYQDLADTAEQVLLPMLR